MEIADALSAAVRNENAARAFVQQQSTFGGHRAGMPIQYVLQAPNIEVAGIYSPFLDRMNASPYFQMTDVDLKFTHQRLINIDRDKAALLVLAQEILGRHCNMH